MRLLAKQVPRLVLVPPKRYLAATGSTATMLRQFVASLLAEASSRRENLSYLRARRR